MKYTRKNIETLHQSGKKLKYLFFWGHQPGKNGAITSACFSQWYNSIFIVEGITYPTAEHWMMAEKAKLFGDSVALKKILEANSPGEAKSIGRQVIGFDEDVWNSKRYKIVTKGNYHKFSQNTELKNFLVNTKKRILVEASPLDNIWGIGLLRDHEFSAIPTKWKGLNLLGFALMEVRDLLIKEQDH